MQSEKGQTPPVPKVGVQFQEGDYQPEIFLDELTTGLDAKARRDVWKILSELKSLGLTIFLTSHFMDEVEALCDEICILKKGKAVFYGTVESEYRERKILKRFQVTPVNPAKLLVVEFAIYCLYCVVSILTLFPVAMLFWKIEIHGSLLSFWEVGY